MQNNSDTPLQRGSMFSRAVYNCDNVSTAKENILISKRLRTLLRFKEHKGYLEFRIRLNREADEALEGTMDHHLSQTTLKLFRDPLVTFDEVHKHIVCLRVIAKKYEGYCFSEINAGFRANGQIGFTTNPNPAPKP